MIGAGSDGFALLAAVLAGPNDDLPRLVLADWLDEHGDPDRAEFIRIEIAIARSEPGDPVRARLFARRDDLFKRHRSEWFVHFTGGPGAWSTARGFVYRLEVDAHHFTEYAALWFDHQPITYLKLTALWHGYGPARQWFAREVFTSPYLSRVESLNLDNAGLNSAGVYWLSRNSDLGSLRELSAQYNRVDNDGARTLAAMPTLAGLRSLDLSHNTLTDVGARLLAESPYLAKLEELWIGGNRVTERAWRVLAERFGRSLMG